MAVAYHVANDSRTVVKKGVYATAQSPGKCNDHDLRQRLLGVLSLNIATEVVKTNRLKNSNLIDVHKEIIDRTQGRNDETKA